MDYLLLIIGFFLLIKGADFFVDGSSSVARKLGISSIIIGLTIVSLGTSAPEAMVSIVASLKGANSMALSNVIGSNLFNLLIVLGISAIIKPLPVDKKIITRDSLILVGITTFLLFSLTDNILNRFESLILIVIMLLYIFILIKDAKGKKEKDSKKQISTIFSIIYIIGGITAIAIGGELVVNAATNIALHFGLSETLVGLTIVAMGTSLPELVTSIIAVKKGEINIAIGNVIGSCIFNILFVIGLSSAISPIVLLISPLADLIILLIVTIMMIIFLLTRKKMSRAEGITCVILYFIYLGYLIINI